MAKTKKTIIFRKTLDEGIFEEMEKKYPKVSSVSKVELKQNLNFFSLPTDENFNISEILFAAEENNYNGYQVIAVPISIISKACRENGYYSIINRSYYMYLSYETHLDDLTLHNIINFLCSQGLVYIFGDKITNIYSVRTFETVQSSRAASRKSKNGGKEPNEDEPGDDDMLSQPIF